MNKFFKTFNRICLVAGHGGGDPGAVSPQGHREADQVILITDIIANLLRAKGLNISVAPHNLGLTDSIIWVNRNQPNSWAIEIHRDSFAGLPNNAETSNRMGVYYNTLKVAEKPVSEYMRDILKREGGSVHTWSRPDSVVGRLGWMRDINTVSHLIECGFMQGDNSESHLRELARRCAVAIYETYTGQSYTNTNSKNKNTGMFKNDDELNTWLKQWGIIRLQEIYKLKKEGYPSHINWWYEEVDNLRKEVETLKKQLANGSQPDTNCQQKLQEIKTIIER